MSNFTDKRLFQNGAAFDTFTVKITGAGADQELYDPGAGKAVYLIAATFKADAAETIVLEIGSTKRWEDELIAFQELILERSNRCLASEVAAEKLTITTTTGANVYCNGVVMTLPA